MEKIKEIFNEILENENLVELQEFLNFQSNEEVLSLIEELKTEKQAIAYRLLKKDKALFVFEQLDLDLQNQLLLNLVNPQVLETIEDFLTTKNASKFNEMPAKVVKRLLQLENVERDDVNFLLGYDEESAGAVMTTNYLVLNYMLTVNEAFAKIREKQNETLMIYTIFITKNERELLGFITLKELVFADPKTKLENLINDDIMNVKTDADEEVVARQIKELDLISMPVVDLENRLVGIITVEEAIDIIDDAATDAIFNEAGISDIDSLEESRSETLINGSLWKIWRLRLPFLLITIVVGLLAGVVIEGFEDQLYSVAALAVFIPIIMDMGGNVGTQSATVFTRGLLLGHLKPGQMRKKIIRELLIGLSLGIIVGVITGVIAGIWQGIWQLGLVVGLSLIFTSMIAALFGFVVPLVLVKLKLDQASGTGPILTGIKDITGLIIYFYLAIWLMGSFM